MRAALLLSIGANAAVLDGQAIDWCAKSNLKPIVVHGEHGTALSTQVVGHLSFVRATGIT